MLLYTVVMWRLTDAPVAGLDEAVVVLLSGLLLSNPTRPRLPAPGYEAVRQRNHEVDRAAPRKGLATRVIRGEQ